MSNTIKKLAHMIKDQRGYTVEDFEYIFTEFSKEFAPKEILVGGKIGGKKNEISS